MPRTLPKMMADEEAEAVLDHDLSDLDFTAFKPLTWEAEPKTPASACACRSPSSTPSRPAPPSAASLTCA